MKSLNIIQKLFKIARVLCEVAFVFATVGFCASLIGLICLCFGADNVLKIGGVTIHGIISENLGYDIKSVAASLSGLPFICAGAAVAAKFAEVYFKNELKEGTPFTLGGAKEMLRLGIITIAVPTGTAVIGRVVEGVVAGFMNVEKAEVFEVYFDNETSIVLGIMFIAVSLLCRYGAEIKEKGEAL